ncbi:MAG: phosphate/phosphite/phosphonate ABC transporter substrate-binding protein [Chloroflexota bacterium]|nr:phosphate/phosphite/phosphonate ABC transporter substrate-binding protein [Dehalococcoidia bacterium]MDW8255226.1 phosphate/phosphite/phosphonate ABC transporter substrate-binding protein [Chloroflexota bacterium]
MIAWFRPLPALAAGMALAVTLSACIAPGGPRPATTGAAGPSVQVQPGDDRANWPRTLRLGLFGGDDAEQVIENARPLKTFLEARLGIPVEFFTGTSYSAVIEAMRANKVDAMFVGPFAYILAVQEANAEALVVGVSTTAREPVFDPSIRPTYFSVISVIKGTGITRVSDLKGKQFAFVDPASASGHLVPKTTLIQAGIDPDKDMKTIFAGSHPTAVAALWNRKVDAAASTERTLVTAAQNGQIELCFFPDERINVDRTPAEIQRLFDSCPDGKIVPLLYSRPIPNTPLAVRRDLPESFKKALRQALLETQNDPEYIRQRRQWFLDPTEELKLSRLDEAYNPLRDVARLLKLDLRSLE